MKLLWNPLNAHMQSRVMNKAKLIHKTLMMWIIPDAHHILTLSPISKWKWNNLEFQNKTHKLNYLLSQ